MRRPCSQRYVSVEVIQLWQIGMMHILDRWPLKIALIEISVTSSVLGKIANKHGTRQNQLCKANGFLLCG